MSYSKMTDLELNRRVHVLSGRCLHDNLSITPLTSDPDSGFVYCHDCENKWTLGLYSTVDLQTVPDHIHDPARFWELAMKLKLPIHFMSEPSDEITIDLPPLKAENYRYRCIQGKPGRAICEAYVKMMEGKSGGTMPKIKPGRIRGIGMALSCHINLGNVLPEPKSDTVDVVDHDMIEWEPPEKQLSFEKEEKCQQKK